MEIDLSHGPAAIASGTHDVAAQQAIPPEVLLDFTQSLLIEYRRLLAERDTRIAELERQLRLAAAAWRPPDAVLQ
jgi:hypothetical protein